MNYAIKYWKEKETNPIEFLNHFRCTTEPIGGGTEHDDDGELVDYDAAVTAIAIAKKDIINKACEWLERHKEDYYDYDAWKDVYVNFNMLIEDFKKAMEE